MLKKIVVRAMLLGAPIVGLLIGGFAVADASAPEAKADGCFALNVPFVAVSTCGYGYGGYGGYPGIGYPGPGYYPPPVYYPPPPPPIYTVGHYGHPCW